MTHHQLVVKVTRWVLLPATSYRSGVFDLKFGLCWIRVAQIVRVFL